MEPTIIIGGLEGQGVHNGDLGGARDRMRKAKSYKNLSTIIVIPTRGVIPARVVESWWSMITPMNQAVVRIFVAGFEVGDAYESAIDLILNHPQLKDFRYILTLEEDNVIPPDVLIRLLENICGCEKLCKEHYAQVAALYWTKGMEGMPMIYGDPKGIMGFQPQMPIPNQLQECNGTGMGATLFHMGLFKEEAGISKPFFKTLSDWTPEGGGSMATQDLYFMGNVRKQGYRIASDNRVHVGHYDIESGVNW